MHADLVGRIGRCRAGAPGRGRLRRVTREALVNDLPIACTLLDAERERRRVELLDRVFARALESRPLADGYALRFAPEAVVLGDLMQVIQLERECCAFLRFRLTVEPGGGPVGLELTGPTGTKAFLESALRVGSESEIQGT